MGPITVPLEIVELVALVIAAIDLVLILLIIGIRLVDRVLVARRQPRVKAARKAMLTAAATGSHHAAADAIPAGSQAQRDAMLAAAHMLITLKGQAHADLQAYLSDAGYPKLAKNELRSRFPLNRGVACEFLGAMSEPGNAETIEPLLRDPNIQVRSTAVRALGRLHVEESVPGLIKTLGSDRPVAAVLVKTALLRIGPAAAEPLIDALGAEQPVTRVSAAQVLGRLNIVAAQSALIEILDSDPDLTCRVDAANALGRLGSPAAREPLLRAVEPNNDPLLRSASARALSGLADKSVIGVLIDLTSDDDPNIARSAATALAESGPRGRTALHDVQDPSAAAYAAEALARFELSTRSRSGPMVGS